MGPVLSHTAALRGRKFGGNGRTRVTPPHSLLQPPPHFILNPLTNLIFFCFFQRVGTLPWELGRWAGSGAVTIGGADLCQT